MTLQAVVLEDQRSGKQDQPEGCKRSCHLWYTIMSFCSSWSRRGALHCFSIGDLHLSQGEGSRPEYVFMLRFEKLLQNYQWLCRRLSVALLLCSNFISSVQFSIHKQHTFSALVLVVQYRHSLVPSSDPEMSLFSLQSLAQLHCSWHFWIPASLVPNRECTIRT